MVQALLDELVDHPHVLAIAILGPEGNLMAASRNETLEAEGQ